MEGSFWRLGHDLADIYIGEMSLRRLWLCINVVAEDPHSPMAAALRDAQLEAEKHEHAAVLNDVHTRYRPKG